MQGIMGSMNTAFITKNINNITAFMTTEINSYSIKLFHELVFF